MPVAAVFNSGLPVIAPRHHVRLAGHYVVITARAEVAFVGPRTRDPLDNPVTVRICYPLPNPKRTN